MSSPFSHIATAGVGAVLAIASASPALASGPAHRSHSFTVTGVVTSVHGNHVRVLAKTEKVGKRVVARNKRLTLTLTTKAARQLQRGAARAHLAGLTTAPSALTPGETITASGTEDSGALSAVTATAAPLPAEALLGTVASVSGSLITLATRDQVDGTSSEHDHGQAMVVDTSHASFTGPASSATSFIPGDSLVVLGEANDGVMLAATVFSFAAPPAMVSGTVSQADAGAKTLTVDSGDGGDQSDGPDDQNSGNSNATSTDGADDANTATAATPVNVDATTADIVINGNQEGGVPAPTFPAIGDHVLVVGSPGTTAGSITAALVFGFNGHDHHGVGHNED